MTKKDNLSLNEKFKIGIHFQNFLFKTLERALSKIGQKGINSTEKMFTLNFCCIAYFRIPQFQEKVIQAIE